MTKYLIVLVSAIALLSSCSSPSPQPRARAAGKGGVALESPDLNTDPCATRMHDICGPLLLYFASNKRLPASLDELKGTPGFGDLGNFVCPVSKKPYVYVPQTVIVPGVQGDVILYDPLPVHDGFRWAITALPPQGGGPLVLKVVALPRGWNPQPQ